MDIGLFVYVTGRSDKISKLKFDISVFSCIPWQAFCSSCLSHSIIISKYNLSQYCNWTWCFLSCLEKHKCKATEFRCESGERTCIDASFRCNRRAECSDRSDEKNCSKWLNKFIILIHWHKVLIAAYSVCNMRCCSFGVNVSYGNSAHKDRKPMNVYVV